MRVIYVDTLFFLNLTVDYFLLLLTARLAGVYRRRRWLALGAAAGAALAVLLYFPQLPAALAMLARLGVCCVTGFAAFGRRPVRELARLCGLFAVVTFLAAGVAVGILLLGGKGVSVQNGVLYFDLSAGALLVTFAVVYLLSGLTLGRGRADLHRKTAEAEITVGTQSLRLRALRDSGNLLRDPMSGKQVMILSAEEAAALFPPPAETLLKSLRQDSLTELFSALQKESPVPLRLLPVHTAAQNGMLVAFSPDALRIDGKARTDIILAMTPTNLELGGDCRALIGV